MFQNCVILFAKSGNHSYTKKELSEVVKSDLCISHCKSYLNLENSEIKKIFIILSHQYNQHFSAFLMFFSYLLSGFIQTSLTI